MASDKAVKFAADLLAETGEAGAALAANATGGAPTTADPWKVVATLIDNLLALKKAMKAEAMDMVPPAPEGEGVVTGVVVSLKDKEGAYGPYTGVVVETAIGNKVWFIAPKDFGAAVGDSVAIEAVWKRAEGDDHFSFGKKAKFPAPAFA